MSPPARLLLASLGIALAVAASEARFVWIDAFELDHQMLGTAVRLVLVLSMVTSVGALVWWPLHHWARRRAGLPSAGDRRHEQLSIDWRITDLAGFDGRPALQLLRQDTGEHRWFGLVRLPLHPLPDVGATVTFSEDPDDTYVLLYACDRPDDPTSPTVQLLARPLPADALPAAPDPSVLHWPSS